MQLWVSKICKEFAEEIRNARLEEQECITSFDVTALFTYIPVAAAIEVIKGRLEQDTELPKRTTLSTNNILELLEFCLNNTYFPFFQNQYFEQTKGAAMGSPVSPIVANIYMEAFEYRAISTVLHPPRIWRRYVDDTFVVQQKSHKEELFQHINTVDTSIKFTMEEAGPDICGTTETWIKQDDIEATTREIAPSGYKILSLPRSTGQQGGGRALVYCDHYNVKQLGKPTNTDTNTLEYQGYHMRFDNVSINLYIIH